jgi:hypothetical protein
MLDSLPGISDTGTGSTIIAGWRNIIDSSQSSSAVPETCQGTEKQYAGKTERIVGHEVDPKQAKETRSIIFSSVFLLDLAINIINIIIPFIEVVK